MIDHLPDATKMVLSPAAAAVLEVVTAAPHCGSGRIKAAAALRAAADQVVPADPCGNDCCITEWEQIRADLLAIAAELGPND